MGKTFEKREDGLGIFKCDITKDNLEEVFNELKEEYKGLSNQPVGLDFRNVKSICPQGVTMLNRFARIVPKMVFFNCCDDVYILFHEAGFGTICELYREVLDITDEVKDAEPLTRGSQAHFIPYGDDKVVKVFDSNIGANIYAGPIGYYEFKNLGICYRMGLKVPLPYRMVKVGDDFGFVVEKINGKSFLDVICEDWDNMEKYVKEFVAGIKKFNEIEVDPKRDFLTDQKEILDIFNDLVDNNELVSQVFTQEDKELARKLFDMIPDRYNLIHGDATINNVMVDEYGNFVYIDLPFAGYGHPIFELCSMVLQLGMFIKEGIDEHEGALSRLNAEQSKAIMNCFLDEFLGDVDDEFRQQVVGMVEAINLVVNVCTFTHYDLFEALGGEPIPMLTGLRDGLRAYMADK